LAYKVVAIIYQHGVLLCCQPLRIKRRGKGRKDLQKGKKEEKKCKSKQSLKGGTGCHNFAVLNPYKLHFICSNIKLYTESLLPQYWLIFDGQNLKGYIGFNSL
jgi:hypothetical protein